MTNDWLFYLQADDLLAALPPTLAADIHVWEAQGMTLDQIAVQLAAWPAIGDRKGRRTPTHGMWLKLRHEMWLLICTDEPKYQAVRADLGKESKAAGAIVLSLISSTISVHLSIEAGMATPFVALLLLALLHTSKEAWCAQLCPRPARSVEQPPQHGRNMPPTCPDDRRSAAARLDPVSSVHHSSPNLTSWWLPQRPDDQ